MKKLYYTVQPDLYPNGLKTGFRTIKVYQIYINKPKLMCKITAMSAPSGKGFNSDEEEIQYWLNENGHREAMCQFEKL